MHTPYIDLNKHRNVKALPGSRPGYATTSRPRPTGKPSPTRPRRNYAKVKVPSLARFRLVRRRLPRHADELHRHEDSTAARPRPDVRESSSAPGRTRVGDASCYRFDYGPTAAIDWDGYICRWFDYHLKGVANGVLDDPPVHVFVMGHNRWRAEQDWPLPGTKWTKYYLHSGGKANSSAGDGTLSTTSAGRRAAGPVHLRSHAPDSLGVQGPAHRRPGRHAARSTGQDLLVYTTPPLEEDLEVVGPITAKLYAATSARDTDWMVRLIDVHGPTATAALLCDGVLRARCRDPERGGAFNSAKLSTIEPGKVYEYLIEFWRATGNAFLKGHRIRVEISSSYYSLYLRNLNTGADNVGLETSHVVAQQTIHHDAQRPTHVVLPVIPAKAE